MPQLVFDFELCLLAFPCKMDLIGIAELSEILQGKEPHGHKYGQLVWAQLTAIYPNHSVMLVKIPVPYAVGSGQL